MLVLGIDIGTTGCKAIVADESGEIAGVGYQGYGLTTGPGGRVEQDPRDWIRGMTASVRQATKGLDVNRIAALALSTQAASSLLVDEGYRPLTPAITWMDTRSAGQRDAIEEELGGDYVYRTTGWRVHAALDMAKGRWLAENEGERFKKARWFVSTLEYVNQFLTGIGAIDPTNAAMRQLMDIVTKQWDRKLMAAACIEERKLPRIRPSGDFLGCLTTAATRELGLHAGVKVYNGAHDQYCGALGAAILNPGELMLSTGTAWVTLAVSDKAVYTSSYLSPGPHVIPGLYGALASLSTSGAALDWLKNNITGSSYAEIDRVAADRILKCSEIYFYPYLAGGCFPTWNSHAKAAFLGLDMDTDRYDMALLCMEGVAFQLRMALDEYESGGIGITDIHVMGGAVNSPMWLSIISAVCGKRMHIMREKDTPCIGAACIAGIGAGLFADYEQAARLMNRSVVYVPPGQSMDDRMASDPAMQSMDDRMASDPAVSPLTEHYQRKYRRYAEKWNILKTVYDQG